MTHHVVVGSGPLGRGTAAALIEQGCPVRIISRSGAEVAGADSVSVDITDAAAARAAVAGAAAIYHCANTPYHRWAEQLPPLWAGILAAAESTGARLVIGTNLYALGLSSGLLDHTSPLQPCSMKGRLRARLEREALDAAASGRVATHLVRASDFYGPGVSDSVLGDRFFRPLVDGRAATYYGRRDVLHSYTYLPDFCQTMVAVGTRDVPPGGTWMAPSAPPVDVDALEEQLRRQLVAAGLPSPPRIKLIGRGMLRIGGWFVPAAREMIEMLYEFESPLVVDASRTENKLGLRPTDLATGLARTIDWYRAAQAPGDNTAAPDMPASE